LLLFFKVYTDEAEIEKLEDALDEAARESKYSKAKEIQSKIDKIKELLRTKRSINQGSLQGEKINLIKCHNALLPCVSIS
jgi:excinuclease UvrABC nuclease subunit